MQQGARSIEVVSYLYVILLSPATLPPLPPPEGVYYCGGVYYCEFGPSWGVPQTAPFFVQNGSFCTINSVTKTPASVFDFGQIPEPSPGGKPCQASSPKLQDISKYNTI